MTRTTLRCGSCDHVCHRHGKSNGKQRWKCSGCSLTQFRRYKHTGRSVSPSREQIIRRLNSEGVGIRGMSRLMGLSPTHICRCILEIASRIRRPDYYEFGQEYELDEVWSYARKKKTSCWVIWAINRRTRVVVDVVVGPRTMENVGQLIDKLKSLHPKKVRTDEWPHYPELFKDFPDGVHRKGRRITNRIERQGATLRNQIKRLNRRTLSFSKSPAMLEATILLYLDSCNWRLYRSGLFVRPAIF